MRTPGFYLVIDLEATCDEDHRIPREQTEIIEIGAVLVAEETLLPVEEFQTFVRPIRHTRLTPFCTRLTTITQAQVDSAPTFAAAIARLAAFVNGRDQLFCSWGDYDRNQLNRDARRFGVRVPLGAEHWNLKEAFRRSSGDDRQLGNGQALRRVGLRSLGTAHRGIDDARNIARLLPFILGRKSIPAAR
jgi:inhibitor of KinA sporulation pathway (predicted exonuclease)